MAHGTRSSNGKKSTQDYTNLLFTDSDSDGRIPDLKLPPVKGKKQKKKRGGLVYRHDDSSCGMWSVMKGFLLLLLLTAVIALAGISFWSLQKISSLQETVDRLQQSDAFTPDSMTKFQTQLVALNKSLTQLKSGEGGTKALSVSIDKLISRVKTFEDTSVELNKQLASSKDLLDLPAKVDSLTSVVATLKNDVLTASSKQTKLESRLEALENRLEVTVTPTKEATSENAVSSEQLAIKVKALNDTMTQNILQVTQRLSGQEAKITTMEEFIKSTASGIDPEAMEKHIQEIIQNVMGNVSSASGAMASDSLGLDGVMKQLGPLMQQMQSLKEQQQADVVSKGEFLLFKEVVMDEFKAVNDTLVTFDSEFEGHVSTFDAFIKNVTSVTIQSSETGDVKDMDSNLTTGNSRPSSPQPNSVKSTMKDTSVGAVTPSPVSQATPAHGPDSKLEELLSAATIRNIDELHSAMNGALSLKEEELKRLLGDDNLTTGQLSPIDTDNDGMYSEEEIATAFRLGPSEESHQ